MSLVYATTARLPSEFAHGLQIVENCAAFAEAGAEVTLCAARRRHTSRPAGGVADPREYYGVGGFDLVRLPCLDLAGHDRGPSLRLANASFALALWRFLRGRPGGDVVYCRDPLVLAIVHRLLPDRPLVYEVHQMATSRRGVWNDQRAIAGARLVVAVTSRLDDYARRLGARATLVAPTGVRAARFAHLPARDDARARLGLPADAFLVGYVGRLRTLGRLKGVDTVVDAAARAADVPVTLAVVGGPPVDVDAVQRRWQANGLAPERLVAPGEVAVAAVPTWLAALDVAVMTLPDSPHFAECASPLKLFEYLAAGLPIVASDLPSSREVLRHEHTALLVPPGDTAATAAALRRLFGDPGLRETLGRRARALGASYTLDVRARGITDAMREAGVSLH